MGRGTLRQGGSRRRTRSSRIASCTAVSVRLRGRFCRGCRCPADGLRMMRRCPMMTTCLPLNFFSSCTRGGSGAGSAAG